MITLLCKLIEQLDSIGKSDKKISLGTLTLDINLQCNGEGTEPANTSRYLRPLSGPTSDRNASL